MLSQERSKRQSFVRVDRTTRTIIEWPTDDPFESSPYSNSAVLNDGAK